MYLKSTSDFGPRRQFLWRLIRPFVPRKTRWFFEGHPKLKGQLWFEDRKLVYHTVRTYKPLYCFEIGTWNGGGSTLFIAQALFENGMGKLYTFFLPYMERGCLLIAHDWFSEKCRLLKPLIEESANWELKQVLSPPKSLGCALAIKK